MKLRCDKCGLKYETKTATVKGKNLCPKCSEKSENTLDGWSKIILKGIPEERLRSLSGE